MHEKLARIADFLRDSALECVFGVVLVLIRSLRGRLRSRLFPIQRLQMQTVAKEDSMDKVIPISPEIAAEVKLEGGKLVISVSADADKLLDLLAAKIPGQVDDAIIQVLKAALKVV